MYRQVNPTELFRERQLALLKETDNRRIVWRLRMARRTPKEGSLMRRTIMLMATMTLAVLAFGGVALAFNVIQCELTTCNGTPQADLIEGTPIPTPSTPGEETTRCGGWATTTLSMAVAVSMT
jgi:hypothetical protein